MKKVAMQFCWYSLACGVAPADAATPVVRITDKPHTRFRWANFADNELATLITPEGKLGKIVYNYSELAKNVGDRPSSY
jgi:hypothetical protein